MSLNSLFIGVLAAVSRTRSKAWVSVRSARRDPRARADRPGIEMNPGASTLATMPFIR